VPNARRFLTANTHVLKTELTHVGRIVDVAQVSDFWRTHQIADSGHVERTKLVPLRDENQRISARHRLILVGGILDLRKHLASFFHCDRIICPDARAVGNQSVYDFDSRRLTHIVRFRFERQTQDRDCLAR